VLAALVITVLPFVAACGTGSNAQSTKPYVPSAGVQGDQGAMRVLNALVVAPEEGGSDGVISVTIVNRGVEPETLTSITSTAGTVDFTGDKQIPGGAALKIGDGGPADAIVRGLTKVPGQSMPLTFNFSTAGDLTLTPYILPATFEYEDLTAPPVQPTLEVSPTPEASASPSASPTTS
jgi:hypothetical protein